VQASAQACNRLVHVYDDVDDRIVHASLAEGLDDLSRFARVIARLAEPT
jgi:uncharacterized protein YutE (UPF0331/DUF86 family)